MRLSLSIGWAIADPSPGTNVLVLNVLIFVHVAIADPSSGTMLSS